MKKLFTALLFVATLMCSSAADAATTFVWRFHVAEGTERQPVEGLSIHFMMADGRNGRRTLLSCSTDASGDCEVRGAVSGGGLFSNAVANGTFRAVKDGYKRDYKADGRQIDKTTRAIDVLVERAEPETFWAVDDTGSALEGVEIIREDKGATVANCTTDGTGSCVVTMDYTFEGSTYARKAGFGHAIVGKSGRVTLHARLAGEVLRALSTARVECTTKEACDRAYATAQIYMARNVDMKTQFSNETFTETYNSTKPEEFSGRVTRAPSGKRGWDVTLELNCKLGARPEANNLPANVLADGEERVCALRKIAAYSQFKDYVLQRSQ